MTTYYVEAYVPSQDALMCDSGLTAAQVDRLREAERNGTIRDLLVAEDIDMVAAFQSPAMFAQPKGTES